jgi:hypothetical protein
MSAKSDSNGWDRSNFNVRLTKARRVRLKSVAAGLSPSATPMEALDQALELALRPREGDGDGTRFDELEDLINARAMQSEIERGHQNEEIMSVRQSLDELLKLISALAEDGADQPGAPLDAPLAFRPWIDRELSARGLRQPHEAIVRAAWRATSAKPPRAVVMDFDAALISVDGKPVRVAAAGLVGIRFVIDAGSEWAGAWRSGPLLIRCSAQASGWKLRAHVASQDGSLGRLVATHDA